MALFWRFQLDDVTNTTEPELKGPTNNPASEAKATALELTQGLEVLGERDLEVEWNRESNWKPH